MYSRKETVNSIFVEEASIADPNAIRKSRGIMQSVLSSYNQGLVSFKDLPQNKFVTPAGLQLPKSSGKDLETVPDSSTLTDAADT
jgi:hypothetical protein